MITTVTLTTVGIYVAVSAGMTYLLWILYLAVMCLKRARDAGLLKGISLALGIPVLIAGLLVDIAVNWLVMTLVLLEIPQEATVTARLKRHNRSSSGWRKAVAVWFEPILDPFDPSGDHI